MKKKLFASFVLVFVVFAIVPQGLSSIGSQRERSRDSRDFDSDDRDFPEKDEFHQTYSLSPAARVDVRGINGTVDIETAPGSTAEVNIIRSARNRDDLEFKKVIVEQTPTSLVVRGENDRERSSFGRNRDVRQRVMLRLPRNVELGVSGINGKVGVGEIDGPVK